LLYDITANTAVVCGMTDPQPVKSCGTEEEGQQSTLFSAWYRLRLTPKLSTHPVICHQSQAGHMRQSGNIRQTTI